MMKLSCEKSELVRGVGRVQNVVASKTTLPILSNILVETNGKRARMVATDLEVGVESSVACDIEVAGTVTIPARRLAEIARELPDGKVRIEAGDEGRVTISAGAVVFKIFGMPKDEFPSVPEVKAEQEFALSGADLKRMVQKTIFAVSTDVTRYTLNGVYWWLKEKELRMVSTDGHRLCVITQKLAKRQDGEVSAIVPTKALDELVRMVEGVEDKDVRVAFTKSHLLAEAGGTTLLSRLIEGKFPNYEQVMPKESDRKMRCPTDRFAKAVRRVSLVASDRAYPVRIELTKAKMTVSAQTPEVGEAREEVEVSFEGKDVSLAINARYLQDVLRSIDTPEVQLEASGPAQPVVLRPVGGDDYLAVVMPMRL